MEEGKGEGGFTGHHTGVVPLQPDSQFTHTPRPTCQHVNMHMEKYVHAHAHTCKGRKQHCLDRQMT